MGLRCEVHMNDLSTWASWAQIISLPVAVIAVLLSLWSVRYSRRKKELSYSHPIILDLVDPPAGYSGRMQLLFDGAPVEDVSLVEVDLHNSGTVEIGPSDFVEPVTLKFGAEAEVLEARVVSAVPADLEACVQIHGETVILHPLLLNPKDLLRLRVIGTRIKELQVNGRVTGVPQIIEKHPKVPGPTASEYLLLAVLLTALTVIALIVQSAFLWGFIVAGIVGFLFQQIRLTTARGSVRLWSGSQDS